MKDTIIEFIHRRFPKDQNWTSGNCYFFALILQSVFGGDIVYDVVAGHFMLLAPDQGLYDWTGQSRAQGQIVSWDEFDKYDSLQKERIIKDCIN